MSIARDAHLRAQAERVAQSYRRTTERLIREAFDRTPISDLRVAIEEAFEPLLDELASQTEAAIFAEERVKALEEAGDRDREKLLEASVELARWRRGEA